MKTKRFLGLLITLTMIIGMLPIIATATEITPVTPPVVTESTYKDLGFSDSEWKSFEGYYAIHSIEEMEGYRNVINTKKTAVNAILRRDLDYSGHEWTPIRNLYGGVFDGNMCCIYKLENDHSDYNARDIGLFGAVINMTIKNVYMKAAYFAGKSHIGTIVGSAEKSTITSCYVNVGSTVLSRNPHDGTAQDINTVYIGGIAGRLIDSTVSNCTFMGKVEALNTYTTCGLIAGEAVGTVSDCTYAKLTNSYCMNSVNTGTEALFFSIGTTNYVGSTATDPFAERIVDAEDVINHSHRYLSRTALVPACGEKGYTSVEHCLICNEINIPGTINNNHEYSADCDIDCNKCFAERDSESSHIWENGSCSACGDDCSHNWGNGECTECGIVCDHSYNGNGECTKCGYICSHDTEKTWTTTNKQHYHACKNGCGIKTELSDHDWKNGVCTVCEYACVHNYKNSKCSLCNVICSHSYELTEIIFEPGCDYEGLGTYTCKICKDSYHGALPVKHGEIIMTGDAGDGTHNMACKDCGDIMDKIPHSYKDGYCTVCNSFIKNPAAEVRKNGIITGYYTDLQEAFDTIEKGADSNAVVKLLKDVDIGDETIDISSITVTLDLNGKILSGSNISRGVLCISGNHITIEDSAEDGAISGKGRYGIYVAMSNTNGSPASVYITVNGANISGNNSGIYNCAGGELVINGGTVTGIYSNWATITINGGTVSHRNGAYAVYNHNERVIINDGTFDGSINACYSTINGGIFLGGIRLMDTTLDNALGNGMAYWQNGTMLSVEANEKEITGGDVIVKAICTHGSFEKIDFADDENNETHTYFLTCCYNTASEAHSWNEDNYCEYCYAGKPFKFYFMDGEKQLFTANVNAQQYYNFRTEKDKNGLTFLGWDEDGDGIADYAGVDLQYYIYVDGDKTFNAVYGDVYLIRYYRIGLDIKEYEISNIQEYPENGVLSLDYDYAYWYTPLGWATEPGGEKVYDYGEEITVTGTLNLYTVWEPFIITFDLGEGATWLDEEGNPVPESIIDSGEFYTAPVREGYVFKHFTGIDQYGNEIIYEFYTDEETGESWLNIYASSKITLTAVWEECTEHSYVNSKCVHCESINLSEFAIIGFDEETKTASVVIPESGAYTVVFADYEGKSLVNLELVPVTAEEEKIEIVPITGDFNLNYEDKVMLWQDAITLLPLCETYIVK